MQSRVEKRGATHTDSHTHAHAQLNSREKAATAALPRLGSSPFSPHGSLPPPTPAPHSRAEQRSSSLAWLPLSAPRPVRSVARSQPCQIARVARPAPLRRICTSVPPPFSVILSRATQCSRAKKKRYTVPVTYAYLYTTERESVPVRVCGVTIDIRARERVRRRRRMGESRRD